MTKTLERLGRITVVSQVTYQTAGKVTSTVISRYSLPVAEDDQKYERPPYSVGEEWVPLDPGWVKEPGMVVVQNDRKSPWLEIGVSTVISLDGMTAVLPCWLVPPGGEHRGFPADFSSVRVRAKEGQCKFVVNVYPK